MPKTNTTRITLLDPSKLEAAEEALRFALDLQPIRRTL